MRYKSHCAKYPKAAEDGHLEFILKHPYKDTTANELAKSVTDWILFSGGNVDRAGRLIAASISGVRITIIISQKNERLSDQNKGMKERIESRGGICYVAKDMESFATWFQQAFAQKQTA